MSQRCPHRIELHRLKYHWSGKRTCLLKFDSLDLEEKKIVARDVLTRIYTSRRFDYYCVYAETLGDWGIMCPHPQEVRVYANGHTSTFPLRNQKWYTCKACSCFSFNEDFEEEKKRVSFTF